MHRITTNFPCVKRSPNGLGFSLCKQVTFRCLQLIIYQTLPVGLCRVYFKALAIETTLIVSYTFLLTATRTSTFTRQCQHKKQDRNEAYHHYKTKGLTQHISIPPLSNTNCCLKLLSDGGQEFHLLSFSSH